VQFNKEGISERTDKKIPLEVGTEEPHSYNYPIWKNSRQQQQKNNKYSSNRRNNNKGDIIAVVKAAAS
jgi:hypothetical protein